jgi:hypothetical protein
MPLTTGQSLSFFSRSDEERPEAIWSVSCELDPDLRLGRPEELLKLPAADWALDQLREARERRTRTCWW